MTTSGAGASAHNPTVRTSSSKTAPMRDRIQKLIELCAREMTKTSNGGLTDADTIWPSKILDILGIEYGPGSELASLKDDERE